MDLTVGTPRSVTQDKLDEAIAETESAMQAALPTPLVVHSGSTYTVPENLQIPFRKPIRVDGTLRVEGILYETKE